MFAYITQTFRYIINAVKYLDDSKDPFEAGDLVEVREEIEYVETNPPVFNLPPELIGKIIKQIEDPIKIANIMLVNKAWYKEGRRRLYRDRDDIMEWLRLKRINKLDGFIRYLNLDRLDEYIRIHKNLIKIREDLTAEYIKAKNTYNKAQDKLPYTYFEYGDEEYDDVDEETKQLYIDMQEKFITMQHILNDTNIAQNEIERFESFVLLRIKVLLQFIH